jgi:MFS family permease
VSNVGTWMQTVAVGALVTERTGRASWTALVAVAAFLPIGVLSPVGGALADRLDRRRCLVAGNLVEAGLATVLAALSATGRASPGAVTAVVFANGCVSALVLPFQQALVPDLVEREDVLAASSLGLTTYNMGRVVGPALAGALIAASSFTCLNRSPARYGREYRTRRASISSRFSSQNRRKSATSAAAAWAAVASNPARNRVSPVRVSITCHWLLTSSHTAWIVFRIITASVSPVSIWWSKAIDPPTRLAGS